jgi:hypothetical protein
MNSNPRVNSSKSKSPSPDSLHRFAQKFGVSRSTSWESHNYDLVHQNSLNQEESKDFPPRTLLSRNLGKSQNRAPLLTDLGGESQGKEPRRAHAYISYIKSQRERCQSHQKKIAKKRLRKSLKIENGWDTIKRWGTTLNHLYIKRRFIQGLACLPIIHLSLKISPWSSQDSHRNS